MLSAIVITKNEEAMISDCLESLQFADEIIVVDTGNSDRTNILSANLGARIVKSGGLDYSRFRNDGKKAARGDWLLYVDADERVSSELAEEIGQLMGNSNSKSGVFALPRRNNYLGHFMQYGGWGGEYVIRLFKSKNLVNWSNPLHEQPDFHGPVGKLSFPLLHYSHRDLSSMVKKTIEFTEIETELKYKSHHPKMTWWRFFRVMATEFYIRFIKYSAWRDGPAGIIDGLFQVFNTFIIYAKLWEKQLSL
jgi:(heptosyl)LPS beta-1,4-glucosyltransferase